MASALLPALTTWEQFQQYPAVDLGHHELRDGVVISVPPASKQHAYIQQQIREALKIALGSLGYVNSEVPYRPVAEYQSWQADVAFVPREIYEQIPDNWSTVYAPALIVEILSPSNRESKLAHQRALAMSAGCQEFWIVDGSRQTVHVTTAQGTKLYGCDNVIPLDAFVPNHTVRVDLFFA